MRALARFLVWIFLKVTITGQENFPRQGPALLTANHLGDADAILGVALSPQPVELLVKAELYDFPILGWLLEKYGVIWIHRGQPDRRALRTAIQALNQGRLVSIAPEGRESLTGGLEEGIGGAAYLAYKSNVKIVPITFTHTENWRVFQNIKHFRKTRVTITVGLPFHLPADDDWRSLVDSGTQEIMQRLASQLPEQYQGVYRSPRE